MTRAKTTMKLGSGFKNSKNRPFVNAKAVFRGFETRSKTLNSGPDTEMDSLSADQLDKIHAYWRACNYLAAGMIYLRENPLLRKPLKSGAHQTSAARALGEPGA